MAAPPPGNPHRALHPMPFDIAALLVATAVTGLVMWFAEPSARRLNLLDHPNDNRKDHATPTPVTGGIAMVAGVIVAGIATQSPSPASYAFGMAAILLLVVGVVDDMRDVRWWVRILAQVFAALILIYVGDVRIEQIGPVFGFGNLALGYLSVPFTVFATVGLINAINMVDGMDGLAGSLVLAALVMMFGAAWYSGNLPVGEKLMVLAGAVAAFLLWNLRLPWRPRARAFMGNAGSAFLGLAIAWVAFRLTQNPGHPVSPVLALWLLPIPVMDCLVLIVRRLREGRSPFAAGRDHIHHLMLDAGFSPNWVLAVLVAFSLLCGLVIGQAMRLDVPHPVLLSAFLLLCGWWYWLTARRARALRFFRRSRGQGPQRDRDVVSAFPATAKGKQTTEVDPVGRQSDVRSE